MLACSLSFMRAPPRRTRNKEPRTRNGEPFPPRSGQVPAVGKSALLPWRTRLRGSRESPRQPSRESTGIFRFTAPHPFALLPYGVVRYHGAPADLRDIPLGTMLHVRAFLPPDPKTSAVPVLPVNNREKTKSWKPRHRARREPRPAPRRRAQPLPARRPRLEAQGSGDQKSRRNDPRQPRTKARPDTKPGDETLTFDAATRSLAWSRMPPHRAPDRRGRLACRRQKSSRRPVRAARHHLEAHARRCVHAVSHLRHLAGRRRDAKRDATSNRDCTRPSCAAAGCPRGSMRSSMASSAAPP
jgi:hypothetical protein